MRSRLSAWAAQHHGALIAAVLFYALCVRIALLSELRHTLYGRALMPDEDAYHKWALAIVAGHEAPGFAPDLPRLPALVFARVYALFSADPLYVAVRLGNEL